MMDVFHQTRMTADGWLNVIDLFPSCPHVSRILVNIGVTYRLDMVVWESTASIPVVEVLLVVNITTGANNSLFFNNNVLT